MDGMGGVTILGRNQDSSAFGQFLKRVRNLGPFLLHLGDTRWELGVDEHRDGEISAREHRRDVSQMDRLFESNDVGLYASQFFLCKLKNPLTRRSPAVTSFECIRHFLERESDAECSLNDENPFDRTLGIDPVT